MYHAKLHRLIFHAKCTLKKQNHILWNMIIQKKMLHQPGLHEFLDCGSCFRKTMLMLPLCVLYSMAYGSPSVYKNNITRSRHGRNATTARSNKYTQIT